MWFVEERIAKSSPQPNLMNRLSVAALGWRGIPRMASFGLSSGVTEDERRLIELKSRILSLEAAATKVERQGGGSMHQYVTAARALALEYRGEALKLWRRGVRLVDEHQERKDE